MQYIDLDDVYLPTYVPKLDQSESLDHSDSDEIPVELPEKSESETINVPKPKIGDETADMVLLLASGSTLRVHQAILKDKSSFFAGIIESFEDLNEPIECSRVEESVLLLVLDEMYGNPHLDLSLEMKLKVIECKNFLHMPIYEDIEKICLLHGISEVTNLCAELNFLKDRKTNTLIRKHMVGFNDLICKKFYPSLSYMAIDQLRSSKPLTYKVEKDAIHFICEEGLVNIFSFKSIDAKSLFNATNGEFDVDRITMVSDGSVHFIVNSNEYSKVFYCLNPFNGMCIFRTVCIDIGCASNPDYVFMRYGAEFIAYEIVPDTITGTTDNRSQQIASIRQRNLLTRDLQLINYCNWRMLPTGSQAMLTVSGQRFYWDLSTNKIFRDYSSNKLYSYPLMKDIFVDYEVVYENNGITLQYYNPTKAEIKDFVIESDERLEGIVEMHTWNLEGSHFTIALSRCNLVIINHQCFHRRDLTNNESNQNIDPINNDPINNDLNQDSNNDDSSHQDPEGIIVHLDVINKDSRIIPDKYGFYIDYPDERVWYQLVEKKQDARVGLIFGETTQEGDNGVNIF